MASGSHAAQPAARIDIFVHADGEQEQADKGDDDQDHAGSPPTTARRLTIAECELAQ